MDIKNMIFNTMDSIGIYIDDISNDIQQHEDIDLREYVLDSIQFISLIVEIEKNLEIEIPDELLFYDKLSSLNAFIQMISDLV